MSELQCSQRGKSILWSPPGGEHRATGGWRMQPLLGITLIIICKGMPFLFKFNWEYLCVMRNEWSRFPRGDVVHKNISMTLGYFRRMFMGLLTVFCPTVALRSWHLLQTGLCLCSPWCFSLVRSFRPTLVLVPACQFEAGGLGTRSLLQPFVSPSTHCQASFSSAATLSLGFSWALFKAVNEKTVCVFTSR